MPGSQGRHELKHRINYADVVQLRSKLPLVACPDQYATTDNGYRVKSLYFDNYQDKVLQEKVHGLNEREKFRLRLYNDDFSFIRLEKKSKRNGLCYKDSIAITARECERLLAGDWSVLKERAGPLGLELYAKMHYQQLRAKSIVEYRREAFVHPMGNVRVTIDHDIRTSPAIHDFLSPKPVALPMPGIYLLEVKYDCYLPDIIRGIVTLPGRTSTSFSKYAITRNI